MKDIRNKTLEIQCDKDELYIIENIKNIFGVKISLKKTLF